MNKINHFFVITKNMEMKKIKEILHKFFFSSYVFFFITNYMLLLLTIEKCVYHLYKLHEKQIKYIKRAEMSRCQETNALF